MAGASRARQRAFTLIELLVVIAIIALLVSILIPALAAAREQGKMAKCLSNLRSICTSMHMYFNEWNDRFPYVTTRRGIASWVYGGKTNDMFWYRPPDFWMESRLRPFNRYVRPTPLETDTWSGNTITRRVEYYEYYCPSDSMSYQRFWDENRPAISSYDDVGVSYHWNIAFFTGTNKGDTFQQWDQNIRRTITSGRAGYSGRLVMFWEDAMDFALGQGIQNIGLHKQFSKHSVGFLDGHAEYKYIDTRSHGGIGWVAINPNFVKRPGSVNDVYYVPLNGSISAKNDDPPR